MGAADSSQLTTRPSLVRAMSPASSSTRRCFMKPGSDMSCAWASSVTGRSPSASDSSTCRRVRSDRAANSVSRVSSEYLTIGFSIQTVARLVKARPGNRNPQCETLTSLARVSFRGRWFSRAARRTRFEGCVSFDRCSACSTMRRSFSWRCQ